ncbi:ATP-binding protein [Candidatus Poribacteria bacterium]|nr:ATP-binding protein [Candidatus Poribacteria bacterium]
MFAERRNGSLRIAVASGKGGTGKTAVATNLAATLSSEGYRVVYADCDVEEPNGHIFLKPTIRSVERVGTPVPDVDLSRCNGCGKCGDICEFSAIVCMNGKVITFPELCHGCDGCILVCPENAIRETQREIGCIERGRRDGIEFIHGVLRVGEAMSAPLIRAVKQKLSDEDVAVIDAPPGTSCPVIETVRDTDFVLLVTEPTPFGLSDLRLAVEMVRALNLKLGVIINRCDIGNSGVRDYCAEQDIPLLLEIPDDREIARAYSRGQMAVEVAPSLKVAFAGLWERIVTRISSRNDE